MQTYSPPVLSAHILPRQRAITATLVIGFALLTAAAAQVRLPLPFTPVPITGQTFAVLLAGAMLGSRAGATSQGLYVLLGLAGLPFFQGGNGGWQYATGPTLGYLVGFIAAAGAVGLLAERRQDRQVATALSAFLAGTTVIYLFGVSWLMVSLQTDLTDALAKGLAPFLVGDLIKVALAGVALPVAWKAAGREHR